MKSRGLRFAEGFGRGVGFFFFFKQKTAYEMLRSLVGSEMCIRDRLTMCYAMYSHDHDDILPPNNSVYDVNTGQPIPGADLTQTWCPGNARTDTNSANIEKGYLFSYNRNAAIYHC